MNCYTSRFYSKLLSTPHRNLSLGQILYSEPYECIQKACLVLGVYVSDGDPEGHHFALSNTAKKFNDLIGGKLHNQVSLISPVPRIGEGRIFYGLHPRFVAIAIVGLGDECLGYNPKEQIDERKEAIRTAAGFGVRLLESVSVSKLFIETFNHAESAAEGASMASWMYQELKAVPHRKYIKKLIMYDSCDFLGWKIGLHKAAAQNLARLLQETPGNNLTPSTFAQTTIETLSKYGISVNVRMQNWAKLRNLNAFLAVAKGSCEPPVFLEILYEGCEPNIQPIVLIGKGVTFDSGGLCLQTCKRMRHGRGDMAGAAAVIATFRAIAALQLPLNVRGLIPLCANIPGASAFKPGDTVKAHNGRTILIEDTDCEGLLMHADALSYSREYCPKFVLDVGTLTPDMVGAMSTAACGVWSNNESLYEMMRIASIHTGDRIIRFPLWDHFGHYMRASETADLHNKTSWMTGGGACKTAAFLRAFLPPNVDWIHLDSYNIFRTDGTESTYLRKGMSGRPTRNIIEFLSQFCCKPEGKKT